MKVAPAEIPPAEFGEHLDAVISGRVRKALALTFVILAVELACSCHIVVGNHMVDPRRGK